jgi:hypothetical protein
MKNFFVIFLCLVCCSACKKKYDAEPTYASAEIAGKWAKQQQFYSPNPQIFLEATNTWRSFISFSFTSTAEPDKIGFANPYVAGKGTNALYMNTLYASQLISSDSGYYNVTIPKCLQLVPNSATVLNEGKVLVIPQSIKIHRKNGTSFDIIIGPSTEPGKYNTVSGLIEVEVQFDETSIGGSNNVKRKYRFTA